MGIDRMTSCTAFLNFFWQKEIREQCVAPEELKRIKDLGGDYESVLSGVSAREWEVFVLEAGGLSNWHTLA